MSFYGSYGYSGCGYRNSRRRRTNRVVYGSSIPCFNVRVGEIIDVVLDLSDELSIGDTVASGAPVPEFVSKLDGSAQVGVISTSTNLNDNTYIEVLVNAQDATLVAGEIWKVSTQVQISDGRTFVRTFSVKVQEPVVQANTSQATTTTTTTTDPGVIISGSGQSVPTTLSAGLFNLSGGIPSGAMYARVQFHTNAVWTLTGATPSDVNSVGNQSNAGTFIDLTSRNEIDSFQFTGTNNGADNVQAFIEYYTGDPNP